MSRWNLGDAQGSSVNARTKHHSSLSAERSKSGNQASARRLTITSKGSSLARVACTAEFSGEPLQIMPDHDYEAPISLTRHDICRALREIGLGAKLMNQALVELGFKLKPFPKPPWEKIEPNAERSGPAAQDSAT